jgi:hypothetical protein
MAAGCYGWNQPTQEFVSQYEPGDLRKDITIFYTGCPTFDGYTYSGTWSTTGYNVRKFLLTKAQSPDYNTSNQNWIVTRYADVLLMKAEALVRSGNDSEAARPLNEVRARVGLSGISPTLDNILHERYLELAWEGWRRNDMVRFDIYKDAYGFRPQQPGEASGFTTVFPIPSAVIDMHPEWEQNPGYGPYSHHAQ